MDDIDSKLTELATKASELISPSVAHLTTHKTKRKKRYTVPEIKRKFIELIEGKECPLDMRGKLECIDQSLAHVYKYRDDVAFGKVYNLFCNRRSSIT
jgi:hypothetical protein